MRAGRLACATLCLAGSMSACDHFLFLTARLPLIAPVDSVCIKRFDLEQVVHRESLTYLVTGTVKINQRFGRGESERLGRLYGQQLMRARDACGGHSPASKGLTINSDDPPAEIWSVKGAAGAVWMRWTAESLSWTLHFPTGKKHYVLIVDTLPEGADFQCAPWLPVERIGIPAPPSGYEFATECSRDGSPGTIVAFGKDTDAPFYSRLSSLWELDLRTLHLSPGDTAGVRAGMRCGRGPGPPSLGSGSTARRWASSTRERFSWSKWSPAVVAWRRRAAGPSSSIRRRTASTSSQSRGSAVCSGTTPHCD